MIKNIHLNNFRSYSEIRINLSDNINVFVGRNGQGKTNLLEAIYFISNIRSHRTKNDKDLIKTNEEFCRIIINKEEDNHKEKVVSVIHTKGKFFSINDNVINTTSEMLGRINTVLFYPSETTIFNDSPNVRRSFFDVEIGKISKNYTNSFQLFNNILKDRNKLLKDNDVDLILLEVLTQKLSKTQIEIIKERKFLIDFMNKNINTYLNRLLDEDLNINIKYESTVKDLDYEGLIAKYKSNQKKDIFYKVTTEGIHRDDYKFFTHDIEIEKILSQGQIRIVLLAVKFVLIDYIKQQTDKYPILLLDDVLSELDLQNQEKLISSIPKDIQTIITTTEENSIFLNKKAKIFTLENSTIIKEEDFDVKY